MPKTTQIKHLKVPNNGFIIESRKCVKDNWFVIIDGVHHILRKPKNKSWARYNFHRSQFVLCLRKPNNIHTDRLELLKVLDFEPIVRKKSKAELIEELHEDSIEFVNKLIEIRRLDDKT